MYQKTAAVPSTSQPIRHATTARGLSAPSQIAAGPKINFLPPEVSIKIEKVAVTSIQNKEKTDHLMHTMHSAKLKIEALEEKEQIGPDKNLKLKLRNRITKAAQEEKDIENNVFNISKDIQRMEKKQEQLASAAAQREKDFSKHFSSYQSLLKNKEKLDSKMLELVEKNQALKLDMHASSGVVQGLGNQIKSLDESIKDMLAGKVGASYGEIMHSSASFLKKHGMQLLSGNTMEELTRCLCQMTDHPMSKEERIKSVASNYKMLRYVTYFSNFIALGAFSIAGNELLRPFHKELERIGNLKGTNLKEEIRIRQQLERANLAYDNKSNQTIALLGMGAVLTTVFIAMAVSFERKSMAKKIANISGENEPIVRTLKRGVIDRLVKPEKLAEEQLFKFAFGLAQHANMKLIKNPMETMAKEVTRLVMDARASGESLISVDAVDGKQIGEYLGRLKSVLDTESNRLEKKLDVEIKKIDLLPGVPMNFGGISEKADFVKAFLADGEASTSSNRKEKAVRDMVDRAKFVNEFRKIFNGGNENMLTNAMSDMIVGISKDIMTKLSAADTLPIGPETSSFVQGIKNAELERMQLQGTLQQTSTAREGIVVENKEIEKAMHDVVKDIKSDKYAMSESVGVMNKFYFNQDQLESLKNELLDNIPVTLKGEYEGLSTRKINNIKGKQLEDSRKLEDMLDEHARLYDAHSKCKLKRKEMEDQLEKVEFLEKVDKADKKAQIEKIEGDIKECQAEMAVLELEEKNLFNNLEKIESVREMLTPEAIRMAKRRHLDQSESDLIEHAGIKGYSSNYRSVGHFLKACLDIHAALKRDIEAAAAPDLDGYFVKSDMDVADGMNRKSGDHVPISASVADIRKETEQGKQKYRIAHIYGYVPRNSRSAN